MLDFRKKYRKDNELLKAPDQIPEGIMNMTKENTRETGKKRTVRIAVISAAACLVIAALAAIPFLNHGTGVDLPLEIVVSIGDLRSAADYGELYEVLTDIRGGSDNGYYAGFGVLTDGAVIEEEVAEEEGAVDMEASETTPTYSATNSANDAVGSDYSQTNTQKENVDEADIIKTDGRYIYRLTGGEIVIIDPHNMTVVSRIQPAGDNTPEDGWFWVSDIYVSGDRLAAMYNREVKKADSDWRYDSYSGVLVYDITDRSAPVQTGDFSQSGYLSDSRLIGDYIYMVTSYGVYSEVNEDQPETFVPMLCVDGQSSPMAAADICILPEPSVATYAVITSVNILDGTEFKSTEATFGCGSTVYADTGAIVLAFSESESTTEETTENGENVTIHTYDDHTKLISYTISNGAITLTATGEVPGSLLNQFSLDRHNGVLRVVTTRYHSEEKIYTDGIDRYEWESSTTNGLYTLNSSMNIIGALDGLAEDERVYSVRFSGDIGYFVTFRQVDPLFAVDLSDPTKPTLLSALKIPGFSQYMHPYADGLMFGLGMDADEETGATNGLKLSMFDISDPANVTEKHKLIMEDIYYSEALNNHKAIVISAARDIIAFPAMEGYLIYGYGDDGFYERFRLELDGEKYQGTLRGLFIGDSFYICSDYTLARYDINTFLKQDELTIAQPEKLTMYEVEELIVADEVIVYD